MLTGHGVTAFLPGSHMRSNARPEAEVPLKEAYRRDSGSLVPAEHRQGIYARPRAIP